jgi:hypothetical protein
VDYLAVKQPLPVLKGWQIQKPLSQRIITKRILTTSADTQEYERVHIARALAQADPVLLGNPRVQYALGRLSKDSSETVRNAVAWWQGAPPNNFIQRLYNRLRYAIQNRRIADN